MFYILNLPAFIIVSLVILLPILGTFAISLFRVVTFSEPSFVGISNYLRLFSDEAFINSVLFTMKFVFFSVSAEIFLGILLALIINEKIPLGGLFRGVVLLPWVIPSVVSGRVWEIMFNYSYGFLNFITEIVAGFRVNWLGTESGAFLSLVIADVWRTVPFVALIILAGLQSVPDDIYDQSKIDGVGPLNRFFFITLPMIDVFILTALIFRTIDALRVFDIVFVLTKGGPSASTTPLTLYAYKYYLSGDFGYGSAVSVILFLLTLLISLLLFRIIGRR